MVRSLMIAFAAGLAVGSGVAWVAGRRWERASWAWSWAGAWLEEAAYLTGQAAGWVLAAVVVIAAAAGVVWLAW